MSATAAPWTFSPFVGDIEPITEPDERLSAILEEAELPPLLPALAFATGDLSLLRPELRPDPALAADPQGGLTPDQQAAIRAAALDVLRGLRDGTVRPAAQPPEGNDLLRIMEFAVGADDMAPYLPLLAEELGARGEDQRAPRFRLDEVAPGRTMHVVVVGAGMSGILMGIRLGQAGIPYTIFEKNDDVGGTWYENTYPGCRVDNPNHNYSYSFAQRHDWPMHFSTQGVLRAYFSECADVFGVRPNVRLRSEVVSAAWSDQDLRWTVVVRGPDGATEVVEADAVVSAVGQLNRPSLPDIPGVGSFAGPAFHSARWDHSVDLAGKRVAVIGTGASAVQFIPEIAEVAGHVDVYQRTPPWLGPTEDYHDEVSSGLRWMYAHVPSYSEWNRFWIFWKMGDAASEAVRVDPDWDGGGLSVSEANETTRQGVLAYLQEQLADRPDLLEKVVPDYPPGAKRMLRDNGIWPVTLKRDNVALVTDRIEEITPGGVRTADGTEHPADVLVYGTGFTASRFLTPITVYGRGGVELHDHWGGEPRAYLGVTVPGFPNLFCLYGPNTNIVVNGSIVYFSECGARLVMGLLELVLRSGARAVEVREDVHDAFNAAVDAENARMAWGASDVNTWYKNDSGRIAQNWPFTLLEYWQRTKEPNPTEYELLHGAP